MEMNDSDIILISQAHLMQNNLKALFQDIIIKTSVNINVDWSFYLNLSFDALWVILSAQSSTGYTLFIYESFGDSVSGQSYKLS